MGTEDGASEIGGQGLGSPEPTDRDLHSDTESASDKILAPVHQQRVEADSLPENHGLFVTNPEAAAFIGSAARGGAHIEVDPRIDPLEAGDLRTLLSFPKEFSIYESEDSIVIATGGGEGKRIHTTVPGRIASVTTLEAHTHPRTDGKVYPFMSLGDLVKTENFGPDAQQILITDEGFVVYKRPQFDPIRNCPTNSAARSLMSTWGRYRGISFSTFEPEASLKRFGDLTEDEAMQVMRDFAKETGMIVKEVEWEDAKGVEEIIDAMNLRKSITDNKAPKIPSVLDDIQIEESLDPDLLRTIRKIARYIDAVSLKEGVLLEDKGLRQSSISRVVELVGQEIEGTDSQAAKDILEKLRARAITVNED